MLAQPFSRKNAQGYGQSRNIQHRVVNPRPTIGVGMVRFGLMCGAVLTVLVALTLIA